MVKKFKNNQLFKQAFENIKEARIYQNIDQIKSHWKSLF